MVVIINTPWSNESEWRNVADLLFSDGSTIEDHGKALEILFMWKSRVGRDIPVAIETTEILFRAAVADSEAAASADVLNLENVRTLYCMAVIRFVNYVNELGQGGPNKR